MCASVVNPLTAAVPLLAGSREECESSVSWQRWDGLLLSCWESHVTFVLFSPNPHERAKPMSRSKTCMSVFMLKFCLCSGMLVKKRTGEQLGGNDLMIKSHF